ncbi:zinc finger HIT domain-containing protein 3 isoform X2 [Mustelus asterias]
MGAESLVREPLSGWMRMCRVCGEQPPKYRCPRCELRYCSVGCYKKHKDDCKPRATDSVSTISEPYPSLKEIQQNGNGHHSTDDIFDDDDEESDRVPLEKLRLLESNELKNLLCNPHLKQLLLTVDKAEDKESIMKTVMQEPIFVEFADQCLQIVEPPEQENDIFAS